MNIPRHAIPMPVEKAEQGKGRQRAEHVLTPSLPLFP